MQLVKLHEERIHENADLQRVEFFGTYIRSLHVAGIHSLSVSIS